MYCNNSMYKAYSYLHRTNVKIALQLCHMNCVTGHFHGYLKSLTSCFQGSLTSVRKYSGTSLCGKNFVCLIDSNSWTTCYHGYHTSASRCVKVNQGDLKGRRTQPPWRVIFLGTDLISLSTLKALHGNMTSGNLVERLDVVTTHNKSSSSQKNFPVYKFATKAGLNIHEWPVTLSELDARFDVGVLVSFGHLIPDTLIKLFPYGIINMHPSLLPRWRGASPIFHTVLNGDKETGVSISEIRPKHFDVGPILMQRRVPIPPCITTGELTSQLADMGAELVLECLKDLPNLGNMVHDQDAQGVTYAHKVDPKTAGFVNWKDKTAAEIDCHFRAIQGYGNLRFMSHLENGKPVIFTEMVDPDQTNDLDKRDIQYRWGDFLSASPGSIAYKRKEQWLLVKCKDGVVGFTKVVCRSRMSGETFYHGFCNHKTVQHVFISEDNQLNKHIFDKRIIKGR